MQQPKFTRHARQRLQQRGSRESDVAIVMTYGDIELPARNGGRFLRLSRKEAVRLLHQDAISVQAADRARRLLVLTDSADRVVTLIKCDPERRTIDVRRTGRRR
jgi:Domain of unknown function (DUF4258)